MIYSNPKKEYKGKIEDYPLENYPDYEPGKPPRVERLWDIDYLDEVERITGSKWGGCQGIGRLREIALIMPTKHEVNPLWMRDPTFFWLRRARIDLDKLQRGLQDLGKLFEENGVKVHWMEIKETMGAWGPMFKNFFGAHACVLKGGAILSRPGVASYRRGWFVNFQKFLTKINCPILHTMNGRGLISVGATVPVADDVIMLFKSIDANDDGLDQIVPVMKRCGVKEMPVAHLTTIYDDFEAGGEYHLDMIYATLDKRVALVYPAMLDSDIFRWLRSKKFKIIEIPTDEHRNYYPANLVTLEPGKVIMAAGAKETIKRVKEAGIEVVECDTSGMLTGANGISCFVMKLVRDPGPGLDD